MQRDGFACRVCSATTKPLNVHHNLYNAGSAPWEYSDTALFTLCEDCHAEEEISKRHLDEMLVVFFRQGGALNHDIHRIATLVNDITDQGAYPAGLSLIQVALDELWHAERTRRGQ